MNRSGPSAAQQELLRLLDLLPAPSVLALDPSAATVVMNRAFSDLLGVEQGETHDLSPDSVNGVFTFWRDGRQLRPDELPTRMAVAAGREIAGIEIEVRTSDGRAFQMMGNAAPLRADGRTITGAVATFMDVSEARKLQAVHEGMRVERDAATARLMYLSEAGRELSESLDLRAVLDTLGRILVPRFADCASMTAFDDRGELTVSHLQHRDRDIGDEVRRFMSRTNGRLPFSFPLARRVLDTGRGLIVDDLAATVSALPADEGYRKYMHELTDRFGFRKAILVPLINRGEPVGVLTAFGERDRLFGEEDLRLLEEFGRRAASAVDNARTYERQRQVAETLQKALLPERLPRTAELQFDAVYVAGDDESQLGGDWYDAFYLSPRVIAVSIGDVTGRGIDAAVLMGKVRQNIRALSLVERDPAKLLDATDAAIRRNNPDLIVTALVGVIDLDAMTMRYASGGHPPPYLRRGGNVVLELPCHGLPLGLRGEHENTTVEISLQLGDVLTFYTDGLLESTHDLSEGERRIRLALSELDESTLAEPANAIRESVLFDGSRDDVAVLTIRVTGPRADRDALEWSFDARDARLAHLSRSFFLQYLLERGTPADDFAGAELVFGEMIGNVVRHAAGPVKIRVDWTGDHPVVEMIDEGRGFDLDAHLPADPMSEAGRGLFLIEALTNAFSVERGETGTHARAVLNLQR